MKKTAFAVLLCLAFSVEAVAAPADDTANLGADLAWTVVERATRSSDMNARADAVRALKFVQGKDTAPILTDALADAQWSVRKHAIIGLVRLGNEKAVKLVEESLYNPSLPLATDAIELVGELPPDVGHAMLLKAVTDAANPARDMLVANILDQAPEVMAKWLADCIDANQEMFTPTLDKVNPGLLPALLAQLAADRRGMVSLTAVTFAIAKNLPVDNAVLNALLKSRDVAIRYMAAEKLAQQGNAEAATVLLPLADGDADGKLRFLRAASMAPSPAIQEKAWAMLKPESSPEMARLIFMCFPATTDTRVLERIDADATGTDAARRPAAVRAIGRVKGTRAIPQLNNLLLRDGNRDVRVAAALALGDLAQVESVSILGQAANDADLSVKLAVLDSLGRIYDKSVVSVASYLAFDRNADVKKAALRAVASVNHPDAIQVLRVAADDPDPAIRYMVLSAMMKLDANSAMARFDRALLGLGTKAFTDLAAEFGDDFAPFARIASKSHLVWARQAVLDSMKCMPTARVTLLQEMALTSNYPETRINALLVMARLEPAVAFENATAMLNDANPLIRAAAFRVIGASSNATVHDTLMRGVEDPDEYVRTVAAAALLEKAQVPGGRPAARPAGRQNTRPAGRR